MEINRRLCQDKVVWICFRWVGETFKILTFLELSVAYWLTLLMMYGQAFLSVVEKLSFVDLDHFVYHWLGGRWPFLIVDRCRARSLACLVQDRTIDAWISWMPIAFIVRKRSLELSNGTVWIHHRCLRYCCRKSSRIKTRSDESWRWTWRELFDRESLVRQQITIQGAFLNNHAFIDSLCLLSAQCLCLHRLVCWLSVERDGLRVKYDSLRLLSRCML